MTSDLSGQTALITGSTSGIGRATALLLAEQGAYVIVNGRSVTRGDETVAAIRAAGGKADFLAADLYDLDSMRLLAERALGLGGGHVDILINNAGIYPFGPSVTATEEDFDTVYDANVKSMFFLTAALIPAMAQRGRGSVVNVSTTMATKGIVGSALYASSKAAVETLTRVWSAEHGPSGVRVNAVSPGPIATEGTSGYDEESLSFFYAGTPASRTGRPQEIAAAVAFLVSADVDYIHGVVLPVDGGAGIL